MTATPADGVPAPNAPARVTRADHARDRRGSPVPTPGMIATRFMELRRRRGLMIGVVVVDVGIPALFMGIRLLLHAFAPRTNPPAGSFLIYVVLGPGLLFTFGFIAAAVVGCTAGSRDLTEGMFRHLVVTGRSRLALYLARIPAALAIVVPLIAIGYTIICTVSALAAPTFIDDWNVNIPPGLSRVGFETWASEHAVPVICGLGSGRIQRNVNCGGQLALSKSAVAPGHSASPRVEALAIVVAKRNYTGYARIIRRPSTSLMIRTGLWIELEAVAGVIVGLGLASLMGQRLIPVILMIVLQMILTPIVTYATIPHLQDVRRSFLGMAMAHLEPSGLPVVVGVPGVTGGVGGPGSALLPESTAQASWVIIAWLVGWTIIGAWRMMTRDA
jgi:hypothetical protein